MIILYRALFIHLALKSLLTMIKFDNMSCENKHPPESRELQICSYEVTTSMLMLRRLSTKVLLLESMSGQKQLAPELTMTD